MEDTTVRSWDEFIKKVAEIQKEYGFKQYGDQKIEDKVLFRGLGDAEWPLLTTLERYSTSEWRVLSYLDIVRRCAHPIESISGQDWDFPDLDFLQSEIWRKPNNEHHLALPGLEFCVHLRHHGFPSPLLDWTASPFIAAFFALEQRIPSAKEAAVLAYVGVTHLKSAGLPNISVQTHYLSTHKRHFLQQAWYTICTRFQNNEYTFAPHKEALSASGNEDMLFTIRIPRTLRLEFLLHLSEMNINHFSLFQSDESLVKTLAFNEIDAYNL